MKRTIIDNCDLTFHDIKKVSFEVTGPYMGSECLKINFQNSSGDDGVVSLFFESAVQVKNIKPLQKLKKIIADIGGIKLNKRRKNA